MASHMARGSEGENMASRKARGSHFSPNATFDETDEFEVPVTTKAINSADSLYDYQDADFYDDPDAQKGKKRTGCIVAIILALVLLGVGLVGGYYGNQLYKSALGVQAEAKEVMTTVNDIKAAIKKGDSEQFKSVAQEVQTSAYHIHDEVNTDLWDYATMIPFYGSDFKSIRVLADVLVDLSDNALMPLANNANVMNLKDVFTDGAINVEVLQSLTSAMDEAGPVLSRSAATIEALPEARIDRINTVLVKLKDGLGEADEMLTKAEEVLPYLPQLLGANGQTRRYLIVAQNNAEARSTGGLPGSCGVLSVTDGHFDLGDFESILHPDGVSLPIDQAESSFWRTNYNTDPAQLPFIADFTRVGTYFKQFWSVLKEEEVDGVIAIDPVFLQRMLALTGPVVTEDGTEINGDNAAEELLNSVYWRYAYWTEGQDWFFSSTASLAAKSFFDNISDAGMLDLLTTTFDLIDTHRLLAWMSNEDEQAVMVALGASGELPEDPLKPEIGVYVNDVTYSKYSWYLRLNIEVGDGTANSDGTTTYPVRVVLSNVMDSDLIWSAPKYIAGFNAEKYSWGDMMNRLYLLGPAGGSLTDVYTEDDEETYTGTVYGLDGACIKTHTATENSDLITFNVTCAAGAEKPVVRATPLGSDDFVTVTYAWGN